ncbi:MAG: carbamoyl transferase [Verrucomicrobia bacterium]|nr:carbamoyl transferase [Verrucomicrobiota bacterium]
MYILGLSSYTHEASCALIRDGVIVAMAEEERFNREKHTSKYPEHAIAYCLKEAGITIRDVDHIAFFCQPLRQVFDNIGHVLRYFPASLNLLRADYGEDGSSFTQMIGSMLALGKAVQRQFGLEKPPKVHFIEHHLCHAASAFYVSPFSKAAILTVDGRGESTTSMLALGEGKTIRKLKEIKVPHSLGHCYGAITEYLGFKAFFDEWKVMGMSAYGKDTYCRQFEELIELCDDGGFKLNLDYFSFHTHSSTRRLSDKFIETFGPRAARGGEFSQHAADIARALQRVTEKVGVHLAKHLYAIAGTDNLCMTGGVVLNCLMNARIVEETGFKNFFIQPIANDAGTSLGGALYLYHQTFQGERTFQFDRVYWGPSYENDAIEPVLRAKAVNYRKSDNIARDTAAQIAQGKIVGWFQGRMESGPRALGNRSITVDPTLPDMKDRLNARVKRREGFRPFAPSVLEENVNDYFIMPKNQPSPYMILIGKVRPEKCGVIPAVTHADGTARVHTVSKAVNPKYWQLIHEFGKIKGVPVLLNTSFNENEPIVCTPEHAVNCFLRTDFDVLAIGDFIAIK